MPPGRSRSRGRRNSRSPMKRKESKSPENKPASKSKNASKSPSRSTAKKSTATPKRTPSKSPSRFSERTSSLKKTKKIEPEPKNRSKNRSKTESQNKSRSVGQSEKTAENKATTETKSEFGTSRSQSRNSRLPEGNKNASKATPRSSSASRRPMTPRIPASIQTPTQVVELAKSNGPNFPDSSSSRPSRSITRTSYFTNGDTPADSVLLRRRHIGSSMSVPASRPFPTTKGRFSEILKRPKAHFKHYARFYIVLFLLIFILIFVYRSGRNVRKSMLQLQEQFAVLLSHINKK